METHGNQLSRYGAIGAVIPKLAPQAQVFFVGNSAGAFFGDFLYEFTNDKDGRPRVFSSVKTALAGGGIVAARGDVILLMPNHSESIVNATDLAVSTAGVSIVSMGEGGNRATFTFTTAATATLAITANNVTFDNCIFVANFADVASAATLTTAADFAFLNCEFRDTSSSLNFTALVDTNTTSNNANGVRIENCIWFGLSATANTCVVKMDGTNDRLYVRNNYFAHAALTAAGFMPIAAGKVVTNMICENNRFNFVGATNLTTGTLITTDGSTNSGLLHNNIVFDLDATTEILVTASSGFKFGLNYSSAVADKSGYLLPAADS